MNELLRQLLFLPEQGSAYARSVDHLHYFVILTTMLGAAAVGATVIAFVVVYRRRQALQATIANHTANNRAVGANPSRLSRISDDIRTRLHCEISGEK